MKKILLVSLGGLLFGGIQMVSASPITGWVIAGNNSGNNLSLTAANSASPVWGDGTTDNAANTCIGAPFNTVSLGIGDSVVLSGIMTTLGTVSANNVTEFRWGMFDVNGSGDNIGWLGYLAESAATSGNTVVAERDAGNPGAWMSNVGSVANQPQGPIGVAFADGTYNFSLAYNRVGAASLRVTAALVNPSTGYAINFDFTDTTPATFNVNRVGFLAGSILKADQILLNNVDVTYNAVPEPATTGLLIAGGLLILGMRKRLT